MVTEEVEHTVGKSLSSNKNIPEPDIDYLKYCL